MSRPTALVRPKRIAEPIERRLEDTARRRVERLRGVVIEVPLGQRFVLPVIS